MTNNHDIGASTVDPATARPGKLRIVAILFGGIVALAMLAVGGLLVFGGSSGKSSDSKVLAYKNARPPKSVAYIDGLVLKADKSGFAIMKRDRSTVKLKVRKPDRPYIDVQHAQTHAALGQPVRVYHRPYKGSDIVVFMEDSPLLF